MSFLDYKYGPSTIRRRLVFLLGLEAGLVSWIVRSAIIALMIRTSMDPSESVYMGPFGWLCFWLVVVFYLW
jgi:hypothetical protein